MSEPSIAPMTDAQRVDGLRRQIRYRLQDSHDIWRDIHDEHPRAGEKLMAAAIHLEAAIRLYFDAFELLLERKS